MKRRILVVAMSIVSLFAWGTAVGEELEFVPYTGQKTDGNYLISDAYGLAQLAVSVRNAPGDEKTTTAVYSQSTFRLTADIDMANESCLPIGVIKGFKTSAKDSASAPRAFAGTFDGCGHTISNFHAAFMSQASLPWGGGVGLFGNVTSAKIQNVKLVAQVIADSCVGALVGVVGDLTTISNCQVTASVTGRSGSWGIEIGGLVGQITGGGVEICDCSFSGTVVGCEPGGFIGYLESKSGIATVRDCTAEVTVTGTGEVSSAGGFVHTLQPTGVAVFERCAVSGTVSTPGERAGGFCSVGGPRVVFADCVSSARVTAKCMAGGFIGSFGGGAVTNCTAWGDVTATASYGRYEKDAVGGFVGYLDGMADFFGCSAWGDVNAYKASYGGGFIGRADASVSFNRCRAAGQVDCAGYGGGFAGWYKSGTAPTNNCCYALGDVRITGGCAGGFVGKSDSALTCSDSYSCGNVYGAVNYVGGFVGRAVSGSVLTRCYATGRVRSADTDGDGNYGSFSGTAEPTAVDCRCRAQDDMGTTKATASADGILALDETGFLSRENFAPFLSSDGVWTMDDGASQPILAWSAPDGKLICSVRRCGSGAGRVCEDQRVALGGAIQVWAEPVGENSFFADWRGNAPFSVPGETSAWVTMRNHVNAHAYFGTYLRTADELQALTNDLAGIHGLANGIDLAGCEWVPIGDDSHAAARYRGRLYGFGHEISGLTITNASLSGSGLFGATEHAEFYDLMVSGSVRGKDAVGGLIGRAYGDTYASNCTVRVTVNASPSYGAGVGGFIGQAGLATVCDCRAEGEVSSTSWYAGGFVGEVSLGGGFSATLCSALGDVGNQGLSGGFVGHVNKRATFSACRADGMVKVTQHSAGGFVGNATAAIAFRSCVARGDVSAASSKAGGFIGCSGNADVRCDGCRASGAVWGGTEVGLFVGNRENGTTTNSVVCLFANGNRAFDGKRGAADAPWTQLTRSELDALEAAEGLPPLPKRSAKARSISSAAELQALTNDLTGIYKLTADIDLAGVEWTPIGTSKAPFKGELYGEGHEIRNLNVRGTTANAGLFGYVLGARIEGVRVKGRVEGASALGGLVGYAKNGTLIVECRAEVDVVSTQASEDASCGAFAGYLTGPVSVTRCESAGTVAVTNNCTHAGGFVGWSYNGCFLTDCASYADVTNGYSYVGGFGGAISSYVTVTNCFAGGAVTNIRYRYVGGFAGSTSGTVAGSARNAEACVYGAVGANNTVGAAHAGVADLTHAETLSSVSFPTFDFTSVWGIDPERGPYLLALAIPRSGYASWARANGLGEPDEVTDGVANVFRYVFDCPRGGLSRPILAISFADGAPVVTTPMPVNLSDVTVKVLASESLTDWANAVETELTVDSEGRIAFPAFASAPQMFFKLLAGER